jgi:hypothetical protein
MHEAFVGNDERLMLFFRIREVTRDCNGPQLRCVCYEGQANPASAEDELHSGSG